MRCVHGWLQDAVCWKQSKRKGITQETEPSRSAVKVSQPSSPGEPPLPDDLNFLRKGTRKETKRDRQSRRAGGVVAVVSSVFGSLLCFLGLCPFIGFLILACTLSDLFASLDCYLWFDLWLPHHLEPLVPFCVNKINELHELCFWCMLFPYDPWIPYLHKCGSANWPNMDPAGAFFYDELHDLISDLLAEPCSRMQEPLDS